MELVYIMISCIALKPVFQYVLAKLKVQDVWNIKSKYNGNVSRVYH